MVGLGCLIIVAICLLFGLSCTRACFFPRARRRVYMRRVVVIQSPVRQSGPLLLWPDGQTGVSIGAQFYFDAKIRKPDEIGSRPRKDVS